MKWMRRAGGLAIVLICIAGIYDVGNSAPAPAADIIGTVRDSSGAPLPNVRVVLTELGREAITRQDGTFVFTGLRPGTYHLSASSLGYAPEHVVITIGRDGASTRINITMRVTPLALSGIQVTASPAGEDPLHVTQATTQLSGKALDRRLGASVGESLREIPGVAARYAGPATSAPVIRGFSGERILVLHDGERTGDLSSTSADHGISIDPLTASQIEIVRGPASLLYGNNALGGVVNIITHDIPSTIPTHAVGRLNTQIGSANPGGAFSASLLYPLSNSVGVTARLGARRMGDTRLGGSGTLENSYLRNAQGVLGAGYSSGALSGSAVVESHGFDYGLPFAPDAEEGGIHIEGRRSELRGRTDWTPGGLSGVVSVRVEGSLQQYQHDEVEPEGEIGTTFNLNTQTLRAIARTQFGKLHGAIGASALLRQYSPQGEEALTPSANNRSAGLFFFQELAFGKTGRDERLAPRLQVGGRYDAFSTTAESSERFGPGAKRQFNNFSGSVGVNVPLSVASSASLSIARAFRAPTVEELYSSAFHAALGSFDIGEPSLNAEVSTGIEGVFRVQAAHTNAQFAAFTNRVSDYIAALPTGDTTLVEDDSEFTVPLLRYSQEDARLWGVEGQIETTVSRTIVVGLVGDMARGEFESNAPLPFMPAARVGVSARFDDARRSLGLEVRHVFPQERVPAGETQADDYTIVNATAGLSFTRGGRLHSLTLRADNLFDVLYREATSRIKSFAPNPGRDVTFVYRLLF